MRLLFDQLPGAVAGREEAVHELRIAARRLRVALLVLTARPSGKRPLRCRAMLRRLTRESGATRDLDVAAGLLDAHLAAGRSRATDVAVLRRHLRAARQRQRRRLAQTLLDADIGRFRSDLDRLLARGGVETQDALEGCARRARARHADVVRRVSALGAGTDPDELHAVRRGVRRLRYLLELRGQLGQPAREASRLLKNLQDALGFIHDEHVLASWLTAHAQRAGRRGANAQCAACTWLLVQAQRARRLLHHAYLNRGPLAIVSRAMEFSGLEGVRPVGGGR